MKLTAEQKLRLAALNAAGDTLTPAEAAEKNFLTQLSADEEGGEEEEEEEAPPVEEEEEGPADDAPAASLSIGQRLGALLAGNKKLAAEAANAKARLTASLAATTAAQSALAAITAERDTLATANATLATRVSELEAEATTVDAAVTDALAGLNISRSKLPKPGAAGDGRDPLEAIQAQMEAEQDPKKRGALANQAWELMRARSKAGQKAA